MRSTVLGCPSFSEQPWPLESCADGCQKQPGSHCCQQNTNLFRLLSQLSTNCFLLQFFADKKPKSSMEFECCRMLLIGQMNLLSHIFPWLIQDVQFKHLLR